LKDIQGDFTPGLDEVDGNRHPKNYTWKQGTGTLRWRSDGLGFIAQDVMVAGIPNAAHLNGNGYYNFSS
jgi:hypothetical protein